MPWARSPTRGRGCGESPRSSRHRSRHGYPSCPRAPARRSAWRSSSTPGRNPPRTWSRPGRAFRPSRCGSGRARPSRGPPSPARSTHRNRRTSTRPWNRPVGARHRPFPAHPACPRGPAAPPRSSNRSPRAPPFARGRPRRGRSPPRGRHRVPSSAGCRHPASSRATPAGRPSPLADSANSASRGIASRRSARGRRGPRASPTAPAAPPGRASGPRDSLGRRGASTSPRGSAPTTSNSWRCRSSTLAGTSRRG